MSSETWLIGVRDKLNFLGLHGSICKFFGDGGQDYKFWGQHRCKRVKEGPLPKT